MRHTRGIMPLFRLHAAGVALAASALLAACGTKESAPNDQASTAPKLRVALLTPGPISDKAWNGGAYEGLTALKDSLGAEISHIQTKTPAEFEENFRQYGAQGYSLVFGHGFEFQDAAARVAPSYPKTNYVVTSGRVTAPNVAGVSFAFEEASYQAGLIAGAVTKSNVLGLIAGTELPPVKASFAAFEMGAKAINPKVSVLVSYIGNWDDVSAAKEQALAQISRGADIIFQNADAAGLGIFQAARDKKVYAFGANANQNALAPEVILGSVVIDLPKAFLLVGREVQAGTFKGRVINLGVKDNVVRLELNPQLQSVIPAAAIAKSDSVGAALKAGTFRALDALLAGSDAAKPIKP
jgi:basic membrane lipoprotein Med (substrate-binding protein (PBP1-ABC) superfamily)